MARKRLAPVVPIAPPEPAAERFALASWGNDLSEVGRFDGRSERTLPFRRAPIPPERLEALYVGVALARRIVDRPADDSIREGFTFEDLPKMMLKRLGEIESDLEDLGVLEAIASADKAARLYGGALLVPLTSGDGPAASELQEGGARNLSGFEIIGCPDAVPVPGTAKGTRAWTDPDWYDITRADGRPAERIHRSRVIRFDGAKIPARMLRETRGWHLSSLNAVYEDLRRLGTVRAYMEAIAHGISIPVYKIAGLAKMLLGGPGQRAQARAAIAELQRTADNNHWVALDASDEMSISNRPVDGLKDLEATFVEAVVMGQEIPREILTQSTPGGLNTGANEGPIRTYYDAIRTGQRQRYTPAIVRVLEFFASSRALKMGDFTIAWTPLWAPSPQEVAAVRETNARADAIYLSSGVVTAAHVAEMRDTDGSMVMPDQPEAIAPAPAAAPVVPVPGDPVAPVVPALAAGAPLAATALNGAQVNSLLLVVSQVVAGLLPRASAIAIIEAAFQQSTAVAESMLGEVGKSFVPTVAVPAPRIPTGGETNPP